VKRLIEWIPALVVMKTQRFHEARLARENMGEAMPSMAGHFSWRK
jgi:hypothetical protein